MESACAFDAWLHDRGYTYNGDAPLTGLTRFEYDKLQLGWIVQQEQKRENIDAEASGRSSHTQQQVSSHKQRLAKRSRNAQRN